jgi:hypothetical protein
MLIAYFAMSSTRKSPCWRRGFFSLIKLGIAYFTFRKIITKVKSTSDSIKAKPRSIAS